MLLSPRTFASDHIIQILSGQNNEKEHNNVIRYIGFQIKILCFTSVCTFLPVKNRDLL